MPEHAVFQPISAANVVDAGHQPIRTYALNVVGIAAGQYIERPLGVRPERCATVRLRRDHLRLREPLGIAIRRDR